MLKGISETATITICNLAGQVIEQTELSPGMHFGGNLAAGVYFVRVNNSDTGEQVFKIIKE